MVRNVPFEHPLRIAPAQWRLLPVLARAVGSAVMLVAVLAVPAIAQSQAASSIPTGKPPVEQIARVQQLSFYPNALTKSIEDKVTVGGTEVLDRALKTNLDYGQDVRPLNAVPDNPLIPKVREILRTLPEPIHSLASRYVVAVYMLEEDYGTGTTEGVQDDQGNWRYTYITLNLTALTRTANEWATWKENSAFRRQPDYRVSLTIQPPGGDTLENALQFILLHELGHAIGLGLGVHGFWDAEGLPAATRDSTFIAQSWQPDGKGWFVSKYAERFPKLVLARFYRFDQAALPLSDAESVYRALNQTNLPSLYGVTNVYDDFAEAFAIYVHTRLLGKPYRVEVSQNNLTRYSYTSCIAADTCPDKVHAVEAVLKTK